MKHRHFVKGVIPVLYQLCYGIIFHKFLVTYYRVVPVSIPMLPIQKLMHSNSKEKKCTII